MRCLPFVVLLAACNGGGIAIDETDTDFGDTDVEDTDVPIDTTLTFELGGSLEHVWGEGVADDVEVVLVRANTDDGDDLSLVFAAENVGALPAGGSVDFLFHLPLEPGDEHFYEPDPEGAPGMEIALFLVGAYVDDDGAAGPTDGDVYVGGAMDLLVYLRGDLSDDIVDAGGEPGWNILSYAAEEIVPIDDGYADYELAANLLPDESGALDLVVVPSLGSVVAVGLLHVGEWLGADVPDDPTLLSTTILADDGNTAVVLPGPLPRPDADHLIDGFEGPMGVLFAPYAGLAWNDADNDGDYDDGAEVPRALSVAAGAESRYAIYAEAYSFQAAFLVEGYGWRMGWGLYDGEFGRADWSDALLLDDQFN